MSLDAPVLPTTSEWRRFGIVDLVELQAGKQSRVFAARHGDGHVAIKLTDRRLADPAVLEVRMAAVESLSRNVPEVVRPSRIDGGLVRVIGAWLMTATPLVSGDVIDLAMPDTAELMGGALARLHAALAHEPHHDLPPVAALDTVAAGGDRAGWQLLHGDFSDQNMISTSAGLRIFDFDDCGYGPIEYDIANSLYMVLFDSEVHARQHRYDTFRPQFLAGYAAESGRQLGDERIDEMIALRIRTLSRWLDDLVNAPIGIRTSTVEWQDTLRAFVRAHG